MFLHSGHATRPSQPASCPSSERSYSSRSGQGQAPGEVPLEVKGRSRSIVGYGVRLACHVTWMSQQPLTVVTEVTRGVGLERAERWVVRVKSFSGGGRVTSGIGCVWGGGWGDIFFGGGKSDQISVTVSASLR